MKHRLHGTLLESFFLLREDHCRGFEQEREWTVEAWTADQGLEVYHEMNNRWMEIVTHTPSYAKAMCSLRSNSRCSSLACYNSDKFREFVLGTRFLQIFNLSEQEEKAVRESDEALLRLAFEWLNFSFFGESSLKMRGGGRTAPLNSGTSSGSFAGQCFTKAGMKKWIGALDRSGNDSIGAASGVFRVAADRTTPR